MFILKTIIDLFFRYKDFLVPQEKVFVERYWFYIFNRMTGRIIKNLIAVNSHVNVTGQLCYKCPLTSYLNRRSYAKRTNAISKCRI